MQTLLDANKTSIVKQIESSGQNLSSHLLISLIVIAIGIVLFIISTVIRKKIKTVVKKKHPDDYKRTFTVIRLIFDAINIFIAIAIILGLLQANGINITSIITGLGIAGAVLDLVIQTEVQKHDFSFPYDHAIIHLPKD